jgi:nucleotide-binding universal stress UspA family protein
MSEAGIERIVVGLDGSGQSRAALDWAIRIARAVGAEVIAVYVARPRTRAHPRSSPALRSDPEWRARAAFRNEWCGPLADGGVRYRALVEEGRPAAIIAEVAERVDASVIVVGRHGRGGLSTLLLGSVSHELTLHARRPLLVISPPGTAGARAGAAAHPAGRWTHQGRERSP